MPKQRLQKKVIENALNKESYSEYLVVLKMDFKKVDSFMIASFYPAILGKITINNYVRYINLETNLENKFTNKIETFKTLSAAKNYLRTNKKIFDLVLNENSKVKLRTLKKLVNVKWAMLTKKSEE